MLVILALEGLEPGIDTSLDSIDLGLDYRASPHLKKLPKSGWQDDSEDMRLLPNKPGDLRSLATMVVRTISESVL